jgi:transcriptional regulator with XRE-family HTH domain
MHVEALQPVSRPRVAAGASLDDRRAFAAGLRMARAALGWSQSDLADLVGMTQRSVHRIEQGQCEPRRTTLLAIENVLRQAGLEIRYGDDGGLAVNVPAPLLKRLGRSPMAGDLR